MNIDSKLIYEAYSNKQQVINEDAGEFLGFLAKVIDPTGVLSWPDFFKAVANFNKDSSIINLGIMVLSFFCALPNFGLLALGAGGVAWGGAKAAARAAIKAGPHAILPATNNMLKILGKVPGGRGMAEKALLKLKDSGKLSQNAYDDILSVIQKGKVDDAAHGANIISGRGGQAGAAGIGVGDIAKSTVGKGTAYQAGARAASEIARGNTGIDNPLGKDFEKELDTMFDEVPSLRSTSTATGRKGKRF